VLSLICLFRRCCISNEVGGEVLSLVLIHALYIQSSNVSGNIYA
jgi:hypothetical protein